MNLSLVVPGLLDRRMVRGLEPPALSALAYVARLLSRGHCSELAVGEFSALLFCLFGVRSESPQGMPVAAVSRLADSASPVGLNAECSWLRADPVHLRADQSRLVLFDASVLSISRDEAAQLVESFNEFYRARGWHLEPLYPKRWYLNVVQPVRIRTSSLWAVAGHDIDAYLPEGEDAQDWHGIMNEVQMLFHDHPVNQARSAVGKPVINSVWFWGEGVCPQPRAGDWSGIASVEPVSRGLAALAGVPCMEPPQTASEFFSSQAMPGNVMIVLDNLLPSSTYGDAATWQESAVRLEKDWFEPLARALKRGVVGQLTLYPCDGRCFRISRSGLGRFWKPVKPLGTFVAHG